MPEGMRLIKSVDPINKLRPPLVVLPTWPSDASRVTICSNMNEVRKSLRVSLC